MNGAAPEELTRFREAFVKSGREGFFSAILSSKSHYVDPHWFAELYARLDEKDQAFQWLEKAYRARTHNVALINTEPALDGLHSDPRFQELLRRLHL